MGEHQPSVLVIDDEEIIRSLLTESLSADGYEVETVPSGEAALDRLKTRRFDLAITDLKMPGMDGIETLKALKAVDRELQVVVMTGYASLETAVSALKGGACDYIEKPFKPTELQPVLQRAMDRSVLEGLMATYGASRVLIATMDHPELCRTVVDLAQGVFHADGVGLILQEQSGGREVHVSGSPAPPESKLLASLMEQARRLGRPYCLPSDEDGVEDLLGAAGMPGAALIYPLDSDEGPMGAICLFRRPGARSFAEGDLQRGILFASEVARALTSVKLRTRLRSAATEVDRLRDRMEQAHQVALQGRLAAALARDLGTPARRLSIGVHFLRDAFQDFQDVITACRARTEQLEAAGVDQTDFLNAEERADIGYLLEQTPRAVSEALDGSSGISTLVDSIRLLGEPAAAGTAGVNLNTVVEAVVATARPELDSLASVELELGDLPQVECHPGALGGALLAVLDNAAEAIHAVVGSSGEKGRIGVRTALKGDHVVVTVSDDGCGIRDKVKGKIFEPWFSTRRESHGTGLGLTQAREVIEERHRGTLRVESRSGTGTVVTMRIPVARGSSS